jgi:hypothetical protein
MPAWRSSGAARLSLPPARVASFGQLFGTPLSGVTSSSSLPAVPVHFCSG